MVLQGKRKERSNKNANKGKNQGQRFLLKRTNSNNRAEHKIPDGPKKGGTRRNALRGGETGQW